MVETFWAIQPTNSFFSLAVLLRETIWFSTSVDVEFNDLIICAERRNCTSEEFRCHDGGCILKQHRCDHDFDCNDGSDESKCDMGPFTVFQKIGFA